MFSPQTILPVVPSFYRLFFSFYSHSIFLSYRFRYGCNDPRRLSPSFETFLGVAFSAFSRIFSPPLSLLSFPFTRLSYSTSPIRLTPSSRDRYRSSDVDTRPDEFLMERVAEPIARPPSQINRFFFSPARLNELDSKFRSFPFRSFHAYHLPVTV